MKKMVKLLTLAALASVATMTAHGQKDAHEDPIPKLFDAYEEKEGVESITISPSLLAMMKNGKRQDRQTKGLISKIAALRILTITGNEVKKNLLRELEPALQKSYAQIMKTKTAGERMALYLRKEAENGKEKQAGALLVTIAEANLTVMYLSGTVDAGLIDAVMSGKISVSRGK
jgi:hypothetical protein